MFQTRGQDDENRVSMFNTILNEESASNIEYRVPTTSYEGEQTINSHEF